MRRAAAPVWILALTTAREAARRKLVLMAAVAGGGFLTFYGLAWYWAVAVSMRHRHLDAATRLLERESAGIFLMLGLYAADLLIMTIAILAASDAISGEISNGGMQTLASKPVQRWQIFLGRWAGLLALLTAFTLALEGGVMAIAWGFDRYAAPHVVQGLGLIWLEMALLLTVTLLWGTRLTGLANGVLSLGLFGLAFFGGWVEQFGTLAHRAAVVRIGIVASLIMPSEALWRRAAFEMRSPLASALGMGPFASVSIPSPLMVGYAAFFTATALVLGLWSFSGRDL